MATRILSDTVGSYTTSYQLSLFSLGVSGSTSNTSSDKTPHSLTFKHIVDYATPFSILLVHGYYSIPNDLVVNSTNVANRVTGGQCAFMYKANWETLGIQDGTEVVIRVVPPLYWNIRSSAISFEVYVNGFRAAPSYTSGDYGSSNYYRSANHVQISSAKDVILSTDGDVSHTLDNYTISSVELNSVEGLLSKENLEAGFTTTQSGVTTATIPVTAATEIVQVEIGTMYKRTSPRNGTARLQLGIGGVLSANTNLPLLALNTNSETLLVLSANKKVSPSADLSQFSHTMTLTPQT